MYLDFWELHELEHVHGVFNGIPLLFSTHYARPQLLGLIIVALLPFVPVVALPADNIITDLIWRLSCVWSELVRETIRGILFVACVVCIHTHGTVKVER